MVDAVSNVLHKFSSRHWQNIVRSLLFVRYYVHSGATHIQCSSVIIFVTHDFWFISR